MVTGFDVFLSHNSRDKPAVEAIAEELKARKIEVWLDKWNLRPGRRWQKELEKAIEQSRAVAVFVGADGLGPWGVPEMEVFLNRATRDESLAVIPVLLPTAPAQIELQEFLKLYTWVDLRGGVTEEGLARLVWGVTGEKPGEDGAQSSSGLPSLSNLPFPSLGSLFKGREAQLAEVAGQLASGGRVLVLHGLGGVGKTCLAVEQAWRQGSGYRALFFLVAESPQALQRSLAGLAGADLLNLKLEGQPEEEVVAAVRGWLRGNPGWLLILDNVDSDEAQKSARELTTLPGGQVLVTSRLGRWPAGLALLNVDTLHPEDSVALLLEASEDGRRHRGDDAQLAAQLAERLGHLPLALEQAAAYVRVRGIGFAQYLADWERDCQAVLAWYDPATTDYPLALAVTWSGSFQRLSLPSRALLRLMAHLAPEPIPVGLFEEGGERIEGAITLLASEQAVDPPSSSVDVLAALAEITRYSLASLRDGSVRVHRLVQEVVRSQVPPETRATWVGLTAQLVDGYAPDEPGDVRTWPLWDLLRSHLERIIELAEREAVLELTTGLMANLAHLLYVKGLYSQAEPAMRRALAIDEAAYGPDHPDVARDLNNLALLLKDTNRLQDAEPLMRRALSIDEFAYGPDHPRVAISLNNLATLLRATNRLQEAEPLLRRALEIDEAAYGRDHPSVARDLNNSATVLHDTKCWQEAEELLRQALVIDERFYGSDHPEVAIDLTNLAAVLQEPSRHEEAEALNRRALEIGEAAYGSDHPVVAQYLVNLATVLQSTNRRRESEPLFRRARDIYMATLGPDHPQTQSVGGLLRLNLFILTKTTPGEE